MGERDARNYGLDILKIVSMLGICVLHVLGRGGGIIGFNTFNGEV